MTQDADWFSMAFKILLWLLGAGLPANLSGLVLLRDKMIPKSSRISVKSHRLKHLGHHVALRPEQLRRASKVKSCLIHF